MLKSWFSHRTLIAGLAAAAFGYSALAQDTFVNTGSLQAAKRYRTGGFLLNDGRVVYAGGADPSEVSFATLEIYTPINGQFSSTTAMYEARRGVIASKLNDGRIFLGGGLRTPTLVNQSAEIFDPATNTFTRVADLPAARYSGSVITLPDGRVFAAGGHATSGYPANGMLGTALLYNPATNTYATVTMPQAGFPVLCVLPNGKVLLCGGSVQGGGPTAAMYLFDPATNTFSALPNMSVARFGHAVELLSTGKVLIVGGDTTSAGNPTQSCEIFDPAVNLITGTAQTSIARNMVGSATLSDGRVLIHSHQSPKVEIYNPTTNTFSTPAGQPSVYRYSGTLTALQDGRVLLASGYTTTAGGVMTTQAQLFTWGGNLPPVANAGADIISYVGSATQGSVTLNGSASSDPDGHPITLTWSGAFGTTTGLTPSVTLPVGIHIVELTAADSLNANSTDYVRVAVVQGADAATHNQLVTTNQTLTTQNATLTTQNLTLTAQNATLTTKNAALLSALQSVTLGLNQIKVHTAAIDAIVDDKNAVIDQATTGN